MTAGAQRAALDAVHCGAPDRRAPEHVADSEDLAADLIEAWTAVGGRAPLARRRVALTGQTLIRELRQRQFLSLDQANALAEFHAARERAARARLPPTEADVNAARDAFLKLEAGLMGDAPPPAAPRRRPRRAPARSPVVGGRGAPKAAATRPNGPLDPSAREPIRGRRRPAVPPERARSSWIAAGDRCSSRCSSSAASRGTPLAGRSRASGALTRRHHGVSRGPARGRGGRLHQGGEGRPERSDAARLPRAHGARGRQHQRPRNAEAVTAVRLGADERRRAARAGVDVLRAAELRAARRFYVRAVQADQQRQARRRATSAARWSDSVACDGGVRWIQRAVRERGRVRTGARHSACRHDASGHRRLPARNRRFPS